MQQLLNTLYLLSEGTYAHLDADAVKLERDGEPPVRIPLLRLDGVVAFGRVQVSPALMTRMVSENRFVVFMGWNGRFLGRLEGPQSGNVLLRLDQYRTYTAPELRCTLAAKVALGKIVNARQVLLRGARDASCEERAGRLKEAAQFIYRHKAKIERLKPDSPVELNELRGLEGSVGRAYFGVLQDLISPMADGFTFSGRTRRPPRDPVNALLSLGYALLLNDCRGALEAVGLDPQVGFLHEVRPGRPALALDLMEEFRGPLVDRLVLSLINRGQIKPDDITERPGGSWSLTDEGRKGFVTAYQKRKMEKLTHPYLKQEMPFGLVPHIQARLLARTLRGDIEHYVPFVWR